MDTAYAAALQREYDMYVAQGRKDRAADVAAELNRIGLAPIETADAAPAEKAVARPRKQRKTSTES